MSREQSSEPPGTERTLRSTARNPRRRQRQSENDTLKTAAPRRKRSKISEDTFKPRASTEIPDVPLDEDENIMVMNGHAHPSPNGHKHSHSYGGATEIPVRNKKSIAKRAGRHDGATTLAQNQCYNVKLLPSTPKELRKEGLEYRGSLGAGNNALAITHKKAIIWDYTGHAASNTRNFDIPFQIKAGEAVPFGALVSNGQSSSDLGLVLISSGLGKIVFYENIDRAASLGLFQNQDNGVEGVLGGLFSGETIVDFVLAEHAGFIIVLSSGRLAQLTLRDAQGKAQILTQFLRIAEPSSGGLLGSLKGFWNSGFKKDLSAVHTKPTSIRGHAQVISLTESAELLVWEVDWSSRSEFIFRVDFKDLLAEEMRMMFDTPELQGKTQAIAAVDFAIINKGSASASQELTIAGADQPLEMLLLVRVGSMNMQDFALVELACQGENVRIVRAAPLPSQHDNADIQKQTPPRLVLPRPGHTAFVQFHNALVLQATQEIAMDTPEAQLRSSLMPADTFEDTIRLQTAKDLAFLDICSEDNRNSNASCVAFVKGSGLLRISVVDVHGTQTPPRISAKSRIEQAIFYGRIQHDNVLNFSRNSESKYSVDEVEDAALAISDEILRADTAFPAFLSPSPTSMEQHLAMKARALSAIVTYIAQNYVGLPRSTLLTLLRDAEQVAAAQELWKTFEQHVASSSTEKRTATVLDEVCSWFGDDSFSERKDLADEDAVRRFFIGGLHRVPKLLTNVRTLIQSLHQDKTQTAEKVLRLVEQANDVVLRTLTMAYTFRTDNAPAYGILPELIEDGLLVDPAAYADIPAFWTSTESMIEAVASVSYLSYDFAVNLYSAAGLSETSMSYVHQISINNPKLVSVSCTQFRECIAWRAARPSENERAHAGKLEEEFTRERRQQLMRLVDLGQNKAGMQIAEAQNDMHALAELVLEEENWLDGSKAAEPEISGQVEEQTNALAIKVRGFFDRYKEKWSNVFFDRIFSRDADGKMLVHAQKNWKDALNSYLRANPSRAKLCWINDVTEQHDFGHASRVLSRAATNREGLAWARKVELSLSKLALMAAEEGPSKLSNGHELTPLRQADDELLLVDLQDQLYELVYPDVQASVDFDATTTNVMNSIGKSVRAYPSLSKLFESNVAQLIQHRTLSADALIDIYTLMDADALDNEVGYHGKTFFLAFKALSAASSRISDERVGMLTRLIWKRCFTSTNWMKSGISSKTSDDDRREILRTTAAWSVPYLLEESNYLSDSIKTFSPSECLGAGCSKQAFAYRFEDEDVLAAIVQDVQTEDDLLRSYIDKAKLDDVVAECVRGAKEAVAGDAEERAFALRQKRQFEAEWNEAEWNEAILAGLRAQHGGVTNGNGVNGFAPGEFMRDAGSDVEMSD